MTAQKLSDYLDEHQTKYIRITHSPAYTASEVAQSAHIPGKDLAKTVMVKLDDQLIMVVLPSTKAVDLAKLQEATGASKVGMAKEDEFVAIFPNCEPGAMPPFGNLYGVNVYVDQSLSEDEEIAFNAGSHTELIQLAYQDFEALVKPEVGSFAFG